MEFAVHGDAETLNSEYSFIVKNKTDILNELNFTDDEALIKEDKNKIERIQLKSKMQDTTLKFL